MAGRAGSACAAPPTPAGRLGGRMMRSLIASAVVAGIVPIAAAQNPFARMAEVRREINAGNSARALALIDSLAAIIPDHPNVVFLRAHANGLAGRADAARVDL